MKIQKAEIIIFELPFVKPFVTSFGAINQKQTIIVKLIDVSGIFGVGEAPVLNFPLYNPETPGTVKTIVTDILFPLIRERVVQRPEEINELFHQIKGNNFAKSAVEIAFYDLFSKQKQKRLVNIIGGKKQKLKVSTTASIHINVKDTISEIQEYVDSGLTCIKLKIKPGFDLGTLRVVRNHFPEIELLVDANASYTLSNRVIRSFRKFDELGISCLEQPLESDDLIDHAKLQKNIKTKIALDESIESVRDIKKAIELGSCRLLNIKIPRVGGITKALQINNICKKNKIKTWVGGLLESPVGFNTNLALATVDNFDFPIDFLGALSYIENFNKLFNKVPFKIVGNHFIPRLDGCGLDHNINFAEFNKYIVQVIKLN